MDASHSVNPAGKNTNNHHSFEEGTQDSRHQFNTKQNVKYNHNFFC